MTKAIRLLPLILAATLSLAACGKADDSHAAVAPETTNEETIAAGELGDANAYEAQGNFAESDILTPVDGIAANDTAGNAAAPGNAL